MQAVTAFEIKKALGKKHRKEFFITECKNGPSVTGFLQFDAVAIYKSWTKPQIRGYEIKINRSDFLSDNKYSLYLPYFHEFYFVVPKGLVDRAEVEENIGLVYYNPKTKTLTTRRKAVRKEIEVNPQMLLYIIMKSLDSDRLPYGSKAEYWEDWLNNKKSNKELSYKVKSRLLKENIELRRENRRPRFSQDIKEIDQVMEKHGLSAYGDRALVLDEALSKKYPERLKQIQSRLEKIVRDMKEL